MLLLLLLFKPNNTVCSYVPCIVGKTRSTKIRKISEILFVFFPGLLFLFIYYFWLWNENGRVRYLSEAFRGRALPQEKAHQETARLAQNIAKLAATHKKYPYVFFLGEFLSFAACGGTFAYYAWLLRLFNHGESIGKAYTDFTRYYNSRTATSHLMLLFPREVTCPWRDLRIRCNINYQNINEMFHIFALLITTIVIILYVINYIYFFWVFKHIHQFADNISQSETSELKNLTFRKKLLVLLLHSNMDSFTHMILMQKMANRNNIFNSNIRTKSYTRHNRPQNIQTNIGNTGTIQRHRQTSNINNTNTESTSINIRSKSPTYSEYLEMEGPAIDNLLQTHDTPNNTDSDDDTSVRTTSVWTP